MIKITRRKRPDRVIYKWKGYEVVNNAEDKDIYIWDKNYWNKFPKSEIPNLIKALLEVSKETK